MISYLVLKVKGQQFSKNAVFNKAKIHIVTFNLFFGLTYDS